MVLTLASPGRGASQSPQPGEVERRTVITLCLQVGSTEKESKRVTYTPPPGWYVRSHHVECTRKYGNSSFSVNTVPQDWNWSSEDRVRESYSTLIDLAGKSGNTGLKAKFALQRDQSLSELRKVRSTHHALVVEATVKGEGFLRGGGGLELTVTAELVFLGTNESLSRAVAKQRAATPARVDTFDWLKPILERVTPADHGTGSRE
jgi:hypothetical protein